LKKIQLSSSELEHTLNYSGEATKTMIDSVPWREAFPEYKDEDLPGVCLRGSRHKEGITQKQLSERSGIPQRHISEMENGKRPIGKEMAKRLGKALNIGYKVFL
jgi:ribosome-binding protein aMBF1 (putative translation factor)